MGSAFWAKPGAFSPWAERQMTAIERGAARRAALEAGLVIASVTGKSPRGPWSVHLTGTDGSEKLWWRNRNGRLVDVIVGAIEGARNG